MKKIAIIGECMIELNGQPFGSIQQSFGGDSLNAAVYLSRSLPLNTEHEQAQVYYVSAMGSDALSKGMINAWKEENIDTSLVLIDENRSPGLYLIQLDEEGERTFLYWRNQSAAKYLFRHSQFVEVKKQLLTMDMVFISGISVAILEPEDRSELLSLLDDLKASGVEIVFDSNFRPALWPKNDNYHTVKSVYDAIYRLTDLALVTDEDEEILWGDSCAEDTLQRLGALGITKVIVKRGKDGCLVQDFRNPFFEQVPTTPVSNVVDTTSAGDSFNGGFLSSYIAGQSLIKSCQRGNALAGIVIQHKGAIISSQATDSLIKNEGTK